jgi:RHS repeat-associated protein
VLGQLVAEYQTNYQASDTRTSYLTADQLGSPRITTDSAGAVKSRHDYMAFGQEIQVGIGGRSTTQKYVDDNIRQQYTGYERDDESGLDYAQARYYSSQHGRFTSVDPLTASATIRNPQTFNRYSYALNSPYKFTDPLGLAATNPQCGNGGRCDTQADGLDKERAHTERRQATQEEFNRALARYLFDRASQGYVGDTWGQLFTATVTTVETSPIGDETFISAVVHFWESDDNHVGHLSVTFSNGIHISFWPKVYDGPIGFLYDGGEEDGLNQDSLDADIRSEGNRKPVDFKVDYLETAGVKAFYENYSKNPGKWSAIRNCSDIVAQALQAGGLLIQNTQPGISLPRDVFQIIKNAPPDRKCQNVTWEGKYPLRGPYKPKK